MTGGIRSPPGLMPQKFLACIQRLRVGAIALTRASALGQMQTSRGGGVKKASGAAYTRRLAIIILRLLMALSGHPAKSPQTSLAGST